MIEPAWFYQAGQQRVGPIRQSALCELFANGTLTPETPVFCEAVKSWVLASEIPGFRAIAGSRRVGFMGGGMPPTGGPGVVIGMGIGAIPGPQQMQQQSALPPAPRRVMLTGQACFGRLILAGLMIAVPMAFLYAMHVGRARLGRLAAEGEQTTGRVAATWLQRDRQHNIVEYEYEVDGVRYHGEMSGLHRDELRAYREGGPILLTYLPSDPQQSTIGAIDAQQAASYTGNDLPMAIFTGVFFALLLVALEANIRRQRSLCRNGTAATATVTECFGYRDGRRRFEFNTADGSLQSGQFLYRSATTPGPLPGERVTVLYDPRNPSKNLVYGIAGLARAA